MDLKFLLLLIEFCAYVLLSYQVMPLDVKKTFTVQKSRGQRRYKAVLVRYHIKEDTWPANVRSQSESTDTGRPRNMTRSGEYIITDSKTIRNTGGKSKTNGYFYIFPVTWLHIIYVLRASLGECQELRRNFIWIYCCYKRFCDNPSCSPLCLAHVTPC